MADIILADNQELTRYALEALVSRDGSNRVYRATDKAGLVELLREHERSIVLLDYALFDFADEDSLLVVSERFVETSWILLSDDLTDKFLRRVIYASHRFSVVFKDSPVKMVRDALAYVARGDRYICQRATETLLNQQGADDAPTQLTNTEIEIVKSIAQGKTTKEIAAERFLSVHTVNTHRKNIFRKLGVNTAHEAVKFAFRAGLVDPSEFYI